MIQDERDQVLRVTQEDIRRLADIVRTILEEGSICAIGNAEKIRENRDLFGEIKNLL